MKRERDHRSPDRDRLEAYINKNPGASFSLLQDIFQMNPGTLRYHLDYLEGEERVRRMRKGREKCYFPFGTNVRSGPIDGRDLGIVQKRLLNIVRSNPGLSKSELMERLGASKEEVNYNLRRLIERRMIWKTMDGSDPCYEYVTRKRLAAEMMAEIMERFLSNEMDRETFLKLKKRIEEDIEEH